MTTTISRPAARHPVSIQPAPDGPTSPAISPPSKPNQRASRGTKLDGQHPAAIQVERAVDKPDPAANPHAIPGAASLLDPALTLAADVLDDIERVLIANNNRLATLTRVGVDKDGEERGHGLTAEHPDVIRLQAMVDALKKIEHDAVLNLQRLMRRHPLGAWVKATKGVGEKQAARLLAAIGDPYINSAKGEPRTVSALWAYSGLHVLPVGQAEADAQNGSASGAQLLDHAKTDTHIRRVEVGGSPGHGPVDTQHVYTGVAAKRRKGQVANWSTKAKMRAYLIAESCMKQLSPQCRDGHRAGDTRSASAVPACACSLYRVVYDNRRAHTAVTHPEWTDGHSHNDALRVASKEILKHLWRAARDWHHEENQ